MALAYISTGSLSGSPATVTFTGMDDTYNEYQFYFVNIHPETAGNLQFQVNDSGDEGGGFDESPITSSMFVAYHKEDDGGENLGYSDNDNPNQADFTNLLSGLMNDADSSASGLFTLYAPSSGTYVKQWIARFNFHNHTTDYTTDSFTSGYINDVTAITEIRFKMSSDSIDAGSIHMYGVG